VTPNTSVLVYDEAVAHEVDGYLNRIGESHVIGFRDRRIRKTDAVS